MSYGFLVSDAYVKWRESCGKNGYGVITITRLMDVTACRGAVEDES